MKKFIKFIIISILSLSCLLWSFSFWYDVYTPDAEGEDIKMSGIISDNPTVFKDYFVIVNKYVWIIAWSIFMGVIIYAGVSLISSEWDEQKLTQANKTLVYWLTWIVVSLWAYVILEVILKLF